MPTTSTPSVSDLINYSGKVALVTGAARGFGFACAKRLAEAGAAVVLADQLEELCQTAAKALSESGYNVHAVTVDVTNENDVNQAVQATSTQFGQLNILVNSAGVFTNYLLEAMPIEEFRRVIDVNVTGSFLTIQAAAKVMRTQGKGGAIVNISSIDAIRPSAPGLMHYDASKHAIWGVTKSAAIELGPHGIRVNAIAPGSSFTEGVEAFLQAGAPAGHDIRAQFDAIDFQENNYALLRPASARNFFITPIT